MEVLIQRAASPDAESKVKGMMMACRMQKEARNDLAALTEAIEGFSSLILKKKKKDLTLKILIDVVDFNGFILIASDIKRGDGLQF